MENSNSDDFVWSVVGCPEEGEIKIAGAMAIIAAVSDRGDQPIAIGSGFVLSACKREDQPENFRLVLVCTAAHVLLEAERYLAPQTVDNNRGNPFALGPGEHLLRRLQMRGIRVMLHPSQSPTVFSQIIDAHISIGSDLAYLVVETDLEPSTDENPQRNFAINSDPLKPGDEVVAFGTPFMRFALFPIPGTNQAERRLIVGTQGRRGKITELLEKGHLCSVPVYQTNIPLPGGMSGGPVMRMRGNDISVEVIGVVSSDIPDDQSREDRKIPGCSYVVPAEWLHCLEAPGAANTNQFRRLREKKLLADRGKFANEIEIQLDEPSGIIRLVRHKKIVIPRISAEVRGISYKAGTLGNN